MSVKNTHPDYNKMTMKWQRCRDAAAGQDKMRERCYGSGTSRWVGVNSDAYIPALKDQTPDDYKAYVNRAPFYNATWRTIAGLNGMMFRKPTEIDVPDMIRPMMDDITMGGEPLQMFAQDIGQECLMVGRIGVLVDYPEMPIAGATLADTKMLNIRPWLCSYTAESIINWRTRRVNNHMVLSMVVLTEENPVPGDDEFTEKYETQYRVLDLDASNIYRQRLFKIDKDTGLDVQIGTDLYPLCQNKPMTYIPFIFISVDDITPELDEPPLIDLVDMNIAHWQTTADYEHGCHFAGLPTAVISGYRPDTEGEKLYIGSASAWVFPDPSAKAAYLEFHGEGLKPLGENITQKEQRMAVLGARMLEPQRRGVESAEAATIHRVGEQAMLSNVAQSISLGLSRALQWFSDWAGATGDAKVNLNHDFYPVPMTPTMLTALIAGWQQGAPGLSDQGLFEQLQQAEIIDADTTLEEEQARITVRAMQFSQQAQGI